MPGVLVGAVLGIRGFAQYQLSLCSRAWILALCDVQPGTGLSPTRGDKEGQREREVPGMVRSRSTFHSDGSCGLGEVEGPV